MKLKNVHIDMFLYIVIAVFVFLLEAFGSETAEKLFPVMYLFVIKLFCGVVSQAANAAKMFRSTSFAEAQKEQKEKE